MRSATRLLRLLALLSVMSIAALGCASDDSSGSDTSSAGDSSSGEPVAGGDLVIARAIDVKQLDPLEAVETATIHSLLMMFETLLVSSPDGGTAPQLATSVEPGDDDLSWTVTLREGVEFSDGTPLTSADVKFTLDRARTSDEGFAYMFAPIAEVTVVDDLTLTITTTDPTSYLPSLLALWTGAILPADFGGVSEEEFFEAPIGTGPFVYDSWTAGETLKLNRNDSYWQEGLPYLDSVSWTTVSDDNARITQLQGDQAQIISDLPFSAIQQLESSPDLAVESFPSLLQYFLMFNFEKEPFQDPEVRTAIAYALDKESMKEAALFGEGEVACSVLPPSMLFYSPDVPCLEFDLDAAKATMAESTVPDGFSTTLLVAGTTGTASTVADIVVENLKEIGIDVQITRVDDAQLYDTQATGDYDMIYQGWASDIPDPDQQLTFMLDPEVGGVESYWTFYENPVVTEQLAAARAEFDETARGDLYAEIQDIQAVDLPQIPLLFQPFLFARSDSVNGFEVLPTGNYFLQNVWLSE